MRGDLEKQFDDLSAEDRNMWRKRFHIAKNAIEAEQRSFERRMERYGVADKFEQTSVKPVQIFSQYNIRCDFSRDASI